MGGATPSESTWRHGERPRLSDGMTVTEIAHLSHQWLGFRSGNCGLCAKEGSGDTGDEVAAGARVRVLV